MKCKTYILLIQQKEKKTILLVLSVEPMEDQSNNCISMKKKWYDHKL
jgi:hypothetical protein